jgi:hypothetical protein
MNGTRVMMQAELQVFYEALVVRLRERGILCGITSGLACVHYDLAQNTKDCDLLCHPAAFGQLVEELSATRLHGQGCRYRGHLSPPLDWEWHAGGWTSHFQWGDGPDAVTLDVFGQAVRGSSPWPVELSGLYVSPHVVAEMKRTSRDKDWPYITLLGQLLLEGGDPRGWLHLYDAETLERLASHTAIPEDLKSRRPALRLVGRDEAALLGAVLSAERLFWSELDRHRIEIYRRALRPYVVAVISSREPDQLSLPEQHTNRMRCARETLARSPLTGFGIARHVDHARAAVGRLVRPEILEWLPDVSLHYNSLQA